MLLQELALISLILLPFSAKAGEIPPIVNLGVEVTGFRLCEKTLVFERLEAWGDYVEGKWTELPADITGDGIERPLMSTRESRLGMFFDCLFAVDLRSKSLRAVLPRRGQ